MAAAIFVGSSAVFPLYADGIASRLLAMSNGGRVKVVWSVSVERGGWENSNSPTVSDNKLAGFDTETDTVHILCDSVTNYIRPLITYDGSRVVWSNAISNTVWICNWDGTNKRMLANGIAGTLWFNEATQKEYVIYVKDCTMSGAQRNPFPVYRLNLDDPADTLLLVNPTVSSTSYRAIQPHWMGISRDGRMIALETGWPGITMYDWEQKKVEKTAGGCWISMPWDNTYRLLYFNNNHTKLMIAGNTAGGRTHVDSLAFCPEGIKCGIDCGKMATYAPEYVCVVDEQGEGEGVGPGQVVVCKLSPSLTSIIDSVYVTPDFQAGFPDVWVEQVDLGSFIEIKKPAGGEEWPAGSVQTVEWTTKSGISLIVMDLSVDSGRSWAPLGGGANTGSRQVTLPDGAHSRQCMIKIKNALENAMADTSAIFSIIGNVPPPPVDTVKKIVVTYPNGGEIWLPDSTYIARWTSTGAIDSVEIALSVDNGARWSLVARTANTGQYAVKAGADSLPSDSCRIRVRSAADSSVGDVSNAVFAIRDTTSRLTAPIVLLSPKGGETWAWDSKQIIRWEAADSIRTVKLSFSPDGGKKWTVSTTCPARQGSYEVTVPRGYSSDSCIVRISHAANSAVYAVSGLFHLQKTVDIHDGPALRIPSVSGLLAARLYGKGGLAVDIALAGRAVVKASLYRTDGRKVSTLAPQALEAGIHRIEWSVGSASRRAMYVLKLHIDGAEFSRMIYPQ